MSLGLTRWLMALAAATLLMGIALAHAAKAQEAAGQWRGALHVQGLTLRIGVEIARAPDGSLGGSFTSPDQSPAPIPLADVKLAGGELSFAAPTSGASYEASWDAAHAAWDGHWRQGGLDLPLVLTRGAPAALDRPQTPKPPFPYRAVEVAVPSAPGVTLAGTLTVPGGKGPFPGVVLITGSGPQDRDETVAGHKPFWVLADYLSRRGIAVLRLDDRGVGKSTGTYRTADGEDFAADAEAAARFLRSRPEIDPRRVGLLGHSEGGAIAPLVASRDPKVAFVVMMAGPGVPGREALHAQRLALMRAAGLTPERIATADAENEKILAAARGATDAADAEARIRAAAPELPPQALAQAAAQVVSPEIRWLDAYDPAPALRALRIPVLALDGSKDLQVVPDVNLPAIRAALKDDAKATVVELPGLNHLFQTARLGLPAEYQTTPETIAPVALKTVGDWIVAATR